MTSEDRDLIRRVVRQYLFQHAPDLETEFGIVFTSVYTIATHHLEEEGRLEPEDPDFSFPPRLRPTAINLAIWVATALIRIAHESLTRSMSERWSALLRSHLIEMEGQAEMFHELKDGLRDRFDEILAKNEPERPRPYRADVPPLHPKTDLEMTVNVRSAKSGHMALDYVLDSTCGDSGFHRMNIPGPTLEINMEEFRTRLVRRVERLQKGLDEDGRALVKDELPEKLLALGHDLYEDLFSKELRLAYRELCNEIRTIQITSNEPWIPWELVCPYDDSDPQHMIDHDFLGGRFQLTRWLAGNVFAPESFGFGRGVCVEAGNLLEADRECEAIERFGKDFEMDIRFLRSATEKELKEELRKGGIGLLHLIAHGEFNANEPNTSRVVLEGDSSFRPGDLHGKLKTTMQEKRMLVFMNSCLVGQQGRSLTGLGGWAKKWILDCRCGSFVGPQWAVSDSLARTFSSTFYESLAEGGTLGQASWLARAAARKMEPESPGWLAFCVYGHPWAMFQPK